MCARLSDEEGGEAKVQTAEEKAKSLERRSEIRGERMAADKAPEPLDPLLKER
jgi:hypothetical protein